MLIRFLGAGLLGQGFFTMAIRFVACSRVHAHTQVDAHSHSGLGSFEAMVKSSFLTERAPCQQCSSSF